MCLLDGSAKGIEIKDDGCRTIFKDYDKTIRSGAIKAQVIKAAAIREHRVPAHPLPEVLQVAAFCPFKAQEVI